MDLSAVFSLAAVNGCAGQGSARSQHQRHPKSDIAVVAGLRRSGIAGLAVIWLIGIGIPAAGFFSTNNRIDSSFKAFMRDVTWLQPVCCPLQPTWRYRRY
jgi:hypothetical protein